MGGNGKGKGKGKGGKPAKKDEITELKDKILALAGDLSAAKKAAKGKGKGAAAAKPEPKVTYDYSELKEGMQVQAEADGKYYPAKIVLVSTTGKRAKAPVKVNFNGYAESEDRWVGGDRLRSKHLKKVVEKPKEKKEAKPKAAKPEGEKRPPLEFTFGYWNIRGLAAVFRMIFEYKGVKYTDKIYDSGEKWFKEDKPKILEKNPLANLPYLECGDDCICQTNAILTYLGRKLRLGGDDYKARIKNEELLHEIYDVRNNMIDISYPFRGVCRSAEESAEKAKTTIAAGPFKKFEAILQKAETDYFSGKAPCTADFHIWEMLDQHRLLAEKHSLGDVFADIPKCKAFYDRFRALPSLEKYFESEVYKFPINNPMGKAYFQ